MRGAPAAGAAALPVRSTPSGNSSIRHAGEIAVALSTSARLEGYDPIDDSQQFQKWSQHAFQRVAFDPRPRSTLPTLLAAGGACAELPRRLDEMDEGDSA